MGKSQKQRAMRRHNPVRVPDSHIPKGLAAASSSSSKKDAIPPILQKMESPDASERKWACVAVSNVIQNDPSTRRLLQGKNVVGILITRLSDSEEEVVVEATGALRNLCVDGGYDICGEMYNKNILTPLKSFVPKISNVLSQYLENPKSAPENAKNLIYEFAENVITIIWCLSETSNKALNVINEMSLVPFLMSFLASRAKLSILPATAAAQCLYVLTDDNPPAIREVKSDASYVSCLVNVVQEEPPTDTKITVPERFVMLRVLAAGILRNISPLPPFLTVSTINLESEILLPLLGPLISSVSLPNAVTEIQGFLAQEGSQDTLAPKVEKMSIKGSPKSDHRSPAEIGLDRIEQRLRTIQLALEILTGVCATLPDPEANVNGVDEEEEEEDMDDEEESPDGKDAVDADTDEMEADETASESTKNGSTPNFLSPLLQPLLHLIQPTKLSFSPSQAEGGGPSPHPPSTSVLGAIHVCALECLNNLFLALAANSGSPAAEAARADTGAGQRVWAELWRALAAVGTDTTGPGQERRREVWNMAAGVLWGVGGVWRGALAPDEQQVALLVQLCDASTDEAVRVKCVGALESLALYPASVDANRVIADYLFSLVPSSLAPVPRLGAEVAIQALASLIDIYSDETKPYDVNFRTHNYLQRLRDAVEGARRAVKAINRKKPGGRELRFRAEETRDNLVAFIKYREKLRL